MNLPKVTVSETAHKSDAPAPAENSRAADTRRASRPSESVVEKGGAASRVVQSTGGAVHVTQVSKHPSGRVLTDHQKQMLANLDKHGDVRGDNAGTTVTVREGGAMPADAKDEPGRAHEGGEPARDDKPAPAAAEAKTEVKPAPKADAKPEPAKEEKGVSAESDERYERLREQNRRLVEELEKRDKASPVDMDERLKELDAIERDFTNDPIAAMRRLVALNAGVKMDAPDVARLMSHLYKEWTGAELNVPMDDGTRAAIGTDRNRLLIERDKRERTRREESEKKRAEREQQEMKTKSAVDWLDKQLTSKYADKFPLLMEHAQLFDNVSPAQALFTAIGRGLSAGEFKSDEKDDVLINHYAKEIEGRYKPRFAKLEEHFTKRLEPEFEKKYKATSTATQGQPQASETQDQAADATKDGVRTLTNASASVAPAAPPSAPTTKPQEDKQLPKWRNEDERRRYYAELRFGSD